MQHTWHTMDELFTLIARPSKRMKSPWNTGRSNLNVSNATVTTGFCAMLQHQPAHTHTHSNHQSRKRERRESEHNVHIAHFGDQLVDFVQKRSRAKQFAAQRFVSLCRIMRRQGALESAVSTTDASAPRRPYTHSNTTERTNTAACAQRVSSLVILVLVGVAIVVCGLVLS